MSTGSGSDPVHVHGRGPGWTLLDPDVHELRQLLVFVGPVFEQPVCPGRVPRCSVMSLPGLVPDVPARSFCVSDAGVARPGVLPVSCFLFSWICRALAKGKRRPVFRCRRSARTCMGGSPWLRVRGSCYFPSGKSAWSAWSACPGGGVMVVASMRPAITSRWYQAVHSP